MSVSEQVFSPPKVLVLLATKVQEYEGEVLEKVENPESSSGGQTRFYVHS
ncbi:hypothetical protein KGV55_03370 [Candidatus Gracilibacteria bacterium]|nr:hypothetical protein [Candidatus Gracilibacteria bacterium]